MLDDDEIASLRALNAISKADHQQAAEADPPAVKPQPNVFDFLRGLMGQIQAQGLQFVSFMPPPAKWDPARTLTICLDPTAEPYRGLLEERHQLFEMHGAVNTAKALQQVIDQAWLLVTADGESDETVDALRKLLKHNISTEVRQLVIDEGTNIRVLEQLLVPQRGAIWELAAGTPLEPIEGMSLQAFEPQPDPSLARIADALERLVAIKTPLKGIVDGDLPPVKHLDTLLTGEPPF